MRIVQDDLWLCTDCLTVAVNGDYTSFDYYYNDKAKADKRIAEVNAGLAKLGPHLVPNFDSETGDGIEEFSVNRCDSCGIKLAGGRHRFAVLGEDPGPSDSGPRALTQVEVDAFEEASIDARMAEAYGDDDKEEP
jgi:ribosomal protein L37AE/L43A